MKKRKTEKENTNTSLPLMVYSKRKKPLQRDDEEKNCQVHVHKLIRGNFD